MGDGKARPAVLEYVGNMKPYHKNPRKISQYQRAQLAQTLLELGDLSGVVHDLNSDEIIGGNQRSDVFDINDCEIEITQRLDAPDAQGTVAHGFIVWQGHRYAYRQVRWTPAQCEQANIVANKAGGDWDDEVLAEAWELEDLIAWGFNPSEIDQIEKAGIDFGEPDENGRDLGETKKKIKPVLYAAQVATFELAVKATGIRNRGDALVAICEAYLGEKGQHDFEIEDFFTTEGTEAGR